MSLINLFSKFNPKNLKDWGLSDWGQVEVINALYEDKKIPLEIMKEEYVEDKDIKLIKPHSLNSYVLLSLGNKINYSLTDLEKEEHMSVLAIKQLLEQTFPKYNSAGADVLTLTKHLHMLAVAKLLDETGEDIAVSELNQTFKVYKYKLTTNGIIIAKLIDVTFKMKTITPVIKINVKEMKGEPK